MRLVVISTSDFLRTYYVPGFQKEPPAVPFPCYLPFLLRTPATPVPIN